MIITLTIAGIASNSRPPGGFGLLACSMPLGFDIRPRRPALEPCDLVALRRNRSLQFRHLFLRDKFDESEHNGGPRPRMPSYGDSATATLPFLK